MENTQTPLQKRTIIIGISAIVLVAISITSWFLFKTYYGNKKPDVVKQEKVVKVVTGTLLLSLLPNEVKGGMPLTFTVDMKDSLFTPIFQYIKQSDNIFIFHTSLSPDRKTYVTGGTLGSVDPKDAADAVGIYSGVFDGKINNVKDGGPTAKFGSQADSKGLVLRLPSISNKGAILYATAPKGTKDINFNWEIHYSLFGNDTQVAAGLSPKWISETSFVYLSTKGLRIHDLIKSTDFAIDSIIDKNGKIIALQPNMMMNVSRDGAQIALSNPEEYKIYLFKKIGDKYVKNKEFGAFGFWPTFSPDGKILATQTVGDLTKLKTAPNPKIVFWDIEEEMPELLSKELDLSAYQNALLFINDWY